METWATLFERAAAYAAAEDDVCETLGRLRETDDEAPGGGGD